MVEPTRHLHIVDDDELLRWTLERELPQLGFAVRGFSSGERFLDALQEGCPDAVLLDIKLTGMDGLAVLDRLRADVPNLPVLVITAHSDIGLAVNAMRKGARDFITKPYVLDDVAIRIERALEREAMEAEVKACRQAARCSGALASVVASDPAMVKVIETASVVAASKTPNVLLLGESGSGKGVLAAMIHRLSDRCGGPFQEINCSALPSTLLESEVFGHERGAFTSAVNLKRGLFEIAHKGTLFLDEIGDMPIQLQAKLLGFLETRKFRRIGGVNEIEVDVRVIAATNQDLELAVKDGNFRNDLYYRLRHFPIRIPPLRQRPADTPELAVAFLKESAARHGKDMDLITPRAMRALERHAWPGNVRELKSAIDRAVLLAPGRQLDLADLPEEVAGAAPSVDVPRLLVGGALEPGPGGTATGASAPGAAQGLLGSGFPDEGIPLEQAERVLIDLALEKAGGNQTQAAKLLHISRDTLRYRMQKHGLLPAPSAPSPPPV